MPEKVFCIGLQKTGTTSIELALRQLGYRVCGEVNGYRADMSGEQRLEDALRKADRFDAFNDFPWNVFYRELDKLFPRSKFILTVRDQDSWIKSCRNHYKNFRRPALQMIFGAPTPRSNEMEFKKTLIAHEKAVRAYFKGRPKDLLVLNLRDGDNWNKICAFLDDKKPAAPFPVTFNGSSIRIRLWRNIIGFMKDVSFGLTERR